MELYSLFRTRRHADKNGFGVSIDLQIKVLLRKAINAQHIRAIDQNG